MDFDIFVKIIKHPYLMKNTYITTNDRRVYKKNNDVITEINKIEEANPSRVSEEENYLEKDRLLKILKTLFINGCSRSVNLLAKAMGVPVAQIKALLYEISLATEAGDEVDHKMFAGAGECRKVYIQVGNRYEISFCGENCTFNHYDIDNREFEKLHVASRKSKNKKK